MSATPCRTFPDPCPEMIVKELNSRADFDSYPPDIISNRWDCRNNACPSLVLCREFGVSRTLCAKRSDSRDRRTRDIDARM